MKVSFENGVGTYSGKYNEVVYQSWYHGRLCYARKYTYPTLGAVHDTMAAIAVNLNKVYLEAEPLYLQDLKTYAARNARENLPRAKKLLHRMPTSKSIFVRCMWLWHLSEAEAVDLATVTSEDIMTMNSPVQSVALCVAAGYLKKVSGYEALTHTVRT